LYYDVGTALDRQRRKVAGPAEFESRFREAIASGRPALLDIDMTALSPLSLYGPRPAGRD
jgi:thiamine pyrophosphate-dependent acetolactate synthase large subunit-like protein